MHYLLVSLSHKNTDITLRERLAFSKEKKLEILDSLTQRRCINEAVVLTTCNRVEVLANTGGVHEALGAVFDVLHHHSGIDRSELEGRADSFEDEGAVRHLFSVASGLESLVIGEAQIAGQLKDDYRLSAESGFCGKKLGRLVEFAFKCSAAVRSQTDLGRHPVSVASAAVAQARQIYGTLGGMTAVVVGTGEMSRLAAQHLQSNDANVIIVTRDIKNGQNLAKELKKEVSIETTNNLQKLINSHRLLFTATGAPHTIITAEMVQPKEYERFWFDIAVPRDIDEIEHEKLHIYAVDDLQNIVNTNMSLREEEAGKAYRIIGEYTGQFYTWLQTLSADPIIKALRDQAQEAAERVWSQV